MATSQDIKLQIIDMLKRRGTYSESRNGIQHYTRCPFCGDSVKLNHAHLSVKINVDTDDPMVFRCLKCNISGIVSETFLEELDIFLDSDMRKSLKSFTKKSMRFAKLVNMEMERFFVPLYSHSSLVDRKLDYINNRLGTEFDLDSAHDHKFILNLYDFMKANDMLDKKTPYLSDLTNGMLQNLNDNYVGFLSTNNNCIVFRDITGMQKYRYYKVTINEKNVNMDSFYSTPSQIDIMYTHPIHIHMAEGIFDILSIKENLIKDTETNYFYASCGFGGVSIIKYLIHHGMNTGLNFHIYSDNDKTDWEHKRYLHNGSYLTNWMDHIFIHRNACSGEKDYGVPLSQISDSFIEIS